ncbi:DNA (cytosine-5-)-methyltransferase [Thomasclavelia cocleata]|jgi:DNA (cytosine-5)-methyltransferase 1|uniref:DNA (cytosine-5-)-methyltransferase n=1 Tax=Thomasclavelia cocleata TaxID=69824 RepID=UPI00242C2BF7|nr:DNA (cytosine-5-)-methyltransferase [Thomasclavelia cocleata]MCI9630791.1 DNA (cytosine-5-)-methyltransferase [Thomasclavelia cocleata]
MEKTVIELFAGVGGFRVGLNDVHEFNLETGRAIENRDWRFVWFNQWEPSTTSQDAFNCYCKRFGEENNNNQNTNISDVSVNDIPNHSLLVGGFPCQDYSVARSLSGEKGIEGKKGVLFWEIKRIIEEKKTPFILLENVDRLLKSPAKQRGRDFGIMLRTFHNLDYNVEWRVINAAEYGYAQRRRRVFIFAWKNHLRYNQRCTNIENFITNESLFANSFPINIEDFRIQELNNDILAYDDTVSMTDNFHAKFKKSGVMINGKIFTQDYMPINIENHTTLGEILENNLDLNQYNLNENQIDRMRCAKDSKSIERENPVGEIYNYSEGSMSFPDRLDLPGRTMLTSEASINRSTHVVQDPQSGRLRFITEIEAERMQGFPDNWTKSGMSPRRRYFMMGNALVTNIINQLEMNLSEIIRNE